MDFEDARAAIYSRLDEGMNATYPGTLVVYENRLNVDLSTQTAPFVAAEIHWNDGRQIGMEASPAARYEGAIYLAVYVKEYEGAAAALALLGYLAGLFKAKSFGGVNTRIARPLPGRPDRGWYAYTLRVPFWFDDNQ